MDKNNNKLIKTNHVGVYKKYVTNEKNVVIDTKYYISYKAEGKKSVSRFLVGTALGGVTISSCVRLRSIEITRIRLGMDARLSNKKPTIFFSEIAQDWMDKQKAEGLLDAKHNRNRYFNHIDKVFAKIPIKDIKPQMILELKAEKLKKYKPATVYHMIVIINAIFQNAIHKTGKMVGQVNPAYKIFTKSEFNNKRERYLSLEEIHLLLEEVSNSDSKVKTGAEAFIRISLSTGARSASCLTLQKRHFNLKERTVELYDAKNKEFYTAYLNDKLLSDEYLYNLLHGLENDDYVLRYKDKPLLRKTLQRFTYPIYKKLFNQDIDDSDEKHKVCNHTLRHTFATHAVMHNDIFLTQKLLNHKSIEQTLRYAKADVEKKRDAVAKMF